MTRTQASIGIALLWIGAFTAVSAAQTANMVLVPVTVTGQRNVPVGGLKEENFKIAEDNADQKIAYFSPDNSPLSIGIILGAGALAARTDRVSDSIREAVETFQKTSNPANEYFVEPFGMDGVNGAANRGLARLARSSNPRRILIIVMDSRDNPGGNSSSPSMEGPMKQSVPIYFNFMSGVQADRGFPQDWLTVFEDVAKSTGGRVLYTEPENEMRTELIKLAEELKGQYAIGFTSSKTAQDGKWRNLKVAVTPPAGQPKVNVKNKSRYFVPKG